MVQRLITLLGNPIRIAILCHLISGSKNVQELMHSCKLSQSAVSQHLAKLRSGGLIASQRVGKYRYYHLTHAKYGQLADIVREFDSEKK